jgi:hypothetical protein
VTAGNSLAQRRTSSAWAAGLGFPGGQGLDICQVFLSATLMAFAFNNRKKSWKSRGNGIIGMGSLAQQFHPFKAFLDGLTAPKPQLVPALAQPSNRNLAPVDPSRLCQWR